MTLGQTPGLFGSKVQALPPAMHHETGAGRGGLLTLFIQMHGEREEVICQLINGGQKGLKPDLLLHKSKFPSSASGRPTLLPEGSKQ